MKPRTLEYFDTKTFKAFPDQCFEVLYFTSTPGKYTLRLIFAHSITQALEKAQELLIGRRIKRITHRNLWR